MMFRFCQLGTARATWEEETLVEEVPRKDWPVEISLNKKISIFLIVS